MMEKSRYITDNLYIMLKHIAVFINVLTRKQCIVICNHLVNPVRVLLLSGLDPYTCFVIRFGFLHNALSRNVFQA